ncbi:MAG: hypothetical protein ACR2QA_16660 [Solirubrobacteraceae bacterium]
MATLQQLSAGHVILGVGLGGAMHGTAAWDAVGVPYHERAAHTDAALRVLRVLIAGIGDDGLPRSRGWSAAGSMSSPPQVSDTLNGAVDVIDEHQRHCRQHRAGGRRRVRGGSVESPA